VAASFNASLSWPCLTLYHMPAPFTGGLCLCTLGFSKQPVSLEHTSVATPVFAIAHTHTHCFHLPYHGKMRTGHSSVAILVEANRRRKAEELTQKNNMVVEGRRRRDLLHKQRRRTIPFYGRRTETGPGAASSIFCTPPCPLSAPPLPSCWRGNSHRRRTGSRRRRTLATRRVTRQAGAAGLHSRPHWRWAGTTSATTGP